VSPRPLPATRKVTLTAPLLVLSVLASGCASHSGTKTAPAAVPSTAPAASAAATSQAKADRTFAGLEDRFHARLGVYMLNTGTGRAVTYNANERFAFCRGSANATSDDALIADVTRASLAALTA
jgi:beta-lactamase class A